MGKININLAQVAEAFKKLSFLRSLSILVFPLVITFAAVVIFTAALLMGRSFRQKVTKQSVPIGKEVESRINSAIPVGQAEAERHYQEQLVNDANLIERTAIESTQRELLGYGIFPAPKETSPVIFTQFGQSFCEGIDRMMREAAARDCPSDEEIKQIATRDFRTPGKDAEKITEELCQARARSIAVYANPTGIGGYDFWKNYEYNNFDKAVQDCWVWQLGYWIIEDVFDTVRKMNANSRNVFSSPVKRIAYIGFIAPEKMQGRTGRISEEEQWGAPKYVNKPEDMMRGSCTGHISNEDIDVVHFSVGVVVSPGAILPFMKELSSVKEHRFAGFTGEEPVKVYKHNQISILQSSVKPAATKEREHNNRYRYGTEPSMSLELVCEYIFNKKGYESIKPRIEKKKEQTEETEAKEQ
jgi:hypothetical protein